MGEGSCMVDTIWFTAANGAMNTVSHHHHFRNGSAASVQEGFQNSIAPMVSAHADTGIVNMYNPGMSVAKVATKKIVDVVPPGLFVLRFSQKVCNVFTTLS